MASRRCRYSQARTFKPDSLKTYLAHYEEHLRSESEGTGSPSWRQRLIDQVDALREMVMSGDPAPLYTWRGQ